MADGGGRRGGSEDFYRLSIVGKGIFIRKLWKSLKSCVVSKLIRLERSKFDVCLIKMQTSEF